MDPRHTCLTLALVPMLGIGFRLFLMLRSTGMVSRLCPLIPIILSTCPGLLAREILELAAWLAIVYDNIPLGMHVPWAATVAATEALSVSAVALLSMATDKIPIPASLSEPAPPL